DAPEICKQRWQHLRADDFARGDTYDAADVPCIPRGYARHRARCRGHGLGMRSDVARDIGWSEAASGAEGQRGAKRPLQFRDLATKRRLGEAEAARGARKTAFAQHGKEGAVMTPVRF